MSNDSLADEIRKEFVTDSESIIRDGMDRAKQLFRFDEQGTIHLTGASELSTKDQILSVLIAQQYAAHAGFVENPAMSTGEIGDKLGMESKTVSARLSELPESYVTKVERGSYQLSTQALPDILDSLEQ